MYDQTHNIWKKMEAKKWIITVYKRSIGYLVGSYMHNLYEHAYTLFYVPFKNIFFGVGTTSPTGQKISIEEIQ